MSFTNGTPINQRRLIDVGLQVTVALPTAASGTVNSNWINLGQPGAYSAYWTANTAGATSPPAGTQNSPAGPYAATERVILNLIVPASSGGGNGSNAGANCNIYLQQCPTLSNGNYDNGNITNVPYRSNFALGNYPYTAAVANAGGNTTAVNIVDQLPPNIAQYIRIQCVTGANTNNMADSTATLQLLF